MTTDEEEEKMRKQVALIHVLATRLPWIVVLVVLVTALFYIAQAFFKVMIS